MVKRKLSMLLICFMVFSLPLTPAFAADLGYYDEPYRNQIHFSPEANWMNDPNGMVYYKGEYHLFYQYHPYGTKWGPMHWGHAVSKDLIHWKHLPIALYPDENGQIFSGSAVIDWNNTAGFGKEAMVAIFTHSGDNGQVQSIAYSLDRGRTWTKYEGNPVMPDPPISDWRDPKVFWHEDSRQWVMSLAAANKVMLYTSPNLKQWTYASEFGEDNGIQANSVDTTSYAMSSQEGGSFTYEGDITLNKKNGREGSGGLVFRADKNAKNGYVVSLDAKNDVVTLNKNVDGSNTEIASKSLTLGTSSTYNVQVDVYGHDIQVFIDNQSVIKETDTEFDYGYYGLTAWNSTASFRNVNFKNTSNFATNLSNWTAVTGRWEDTMEGKSGTSADDAFIISGKTGDNFIYNAIIDLSEGGDETGSLVFRTDADAKNGYMTSIDALNDKVKIVKMEDGNKTVLAETTVTLDTYQSHDLKVSTFGTNIKMYLDGNLIHDIDDATFLSGHFGLHLLHSSAIFQDVQLGRNIMTDEKEIINHDFETGDLTGWTVTQGDTFSNDHVSSEATYWGGPFGHEGNYHLWGYSKLHEGDEATGELHSSYFKLSGSGEINLLLGAGDDGDNTYVSLVRAADDQELIRQANIKFNEEKYSKYVWDASKYIGEVLYIKVVDHAKDGYGHINVDDVNVYNEGTISDKVDQVAKEPEKTDMKQSGLLTDWSAVSGQWIPSTNGSIGGVWECPTLVELPVDGDPSKRKWVLQVSINDGAPAGGSGMQYFVGSFDGKTFKNENTSDKVLWTDYGADFYAAVDWSGVEGKKGEKYWLGWMSNWKYANDTPTSTWRSSTTLPRKMELTQTTKGLRLKQTPISLKSIRDRGDRISYTNKMISGNSHLLSNLSEDTFELIALFDVSDTKATEFGFKIREGGEQYTTVGYDVYNEQLFVDRTHSGDFDYGSSVVGKHEGPLQAKNGTVKLQVIVDRSAVEVFGNDGTTVITDQIFADSASKGLKIYSKGGNVKLKSLDLYPLKSVWKEKNSSFKSNLSGWTIVNGNWADTIHGKQGQSKGDAFIVSKVTGRNFVYEANINVPDTDSHPGNSEKDLIDNSIGAGSLVFRSDLTAKNSYAANVDIKNNIVKLIKFVDGTGYEIATYNNDGKLDLQPNTDYHLKVEAQGDITKVYLNNKLVIDTKDQTYKEGNFGLNVWDTTAFFNEVKVKLKHKDE
ncbi:GH32 C-terminal domain-containing protein [Paenibacillus polymyxa]|uniref:GH32 C-terminal domain-containing protein n=1 Tax=Paenibacillus polymyxa TaxID=1406 RepID=UPI003D7682B7